LGKRVPQILPVPYAQRGCLFFPGHASCSADTVEKVMRKT
jgi:hypothetical protein